MNDNQIHTNQIGEWIWRLGLVIGMGIGIEIGIQIENHI